MLALYESGLFIRFSDSKIGEKCIEKQNATYDKFIKKKKQKISAKGQNLDFSEAIAAILENGGHNFTLNPHLFIVSTSVLVSSSSSSNFTYLIS